MNKNIITQQIILLILFTLFVNNTHAIQAYAKPFPIIQSNGDTVLLKKIGNRKKNFIITLDGWIVKQNNNNDFFYVKKNNKNSEQISSLIAKNEKKRSRKENKWLLKNGINIYNNEP